jgi:hypothetical protein
MIGLHGGLMSEHWVCRKWRSHVGSLIRGGRVMTRRWGLPLLHDGGRRGLQLAVRHGSREVGRPGWYALLLRLPVGLGEGFVLGSENIRGQRSLRGGKVGSPSRHRCSFGRRQRSIEGREIEGPGVSAIRGEGASCVGIDGAFPARAEDLICD